LYFGSAKASNVSDTVRLKSGEKPPPPAAMIIWKCQRRRPMAVSSATTELPNRFMP
jgi:hypothetical protein